MNYRHVYRSLIEDCSTEEEKKEIREDYRCLAKLSGSNKVETEEFMREVEEEIMNDGRYREA